MDIRQTTRDIITLYRNNSTDDTQWRDAVKNFQLCLEQTEDAQSLEDCILEDTNWELSVDERLRLLRKAKSLGASSQRFLMDYYGYLAAHLDPGVEKETAKRELDNLITQSRA